MGGNWSGRSTISETMRDRESISVTARLLINFSREFKLRMPTNIRVAVRMRPLLEREVPHETSELVTPDRLRSQIK